MSRFLIIFFLTYGAMHLYAFTRVRAAVAPGTTASILLAGFMLLMTVAPLIVRQVERQGFEATARFIAFVGYTWLGFLFLFVSAAIVVDFYRLVTWVAGLIAKNDLTSITVSPRPAFYLPFFTALTLTTYGYYEASHVRIERVTVRSSKIPAEAGKITIAQISDVHLGLLLRDGRLQQILEVVRQVNPDILVSTGDLVDGQINHLDGISALFSGVNPRYGKFAITGNHEFFAGLPQALEFTRRAGFTMLRNESTDAGGVIEIAGMDDQVANAIEGKRNPSSRDILSKLPREKFTLLLTHRPLVEEGTQGLFDLQLSGHTHKGQIFPFGLATRLFFPYHAGRYDLPGGSVLYVSRGSGTWGPPLRVFSPPEVTVIELVHQ